MNEESPVYYGRTVNKVYNQEFIIDRRFKIIKELGHGAYGIVCSAKYDDGSTDSSTASASSAGDGSNLSSSADGSYVAIKKITNIFSKKILCKRALREIKLLQFFRGHKNITCLYDLDIIPNPLTGEFNEIYVYEELMECDMHQIIRSGQPLTDLHYQSFIYQILCGLKYIHSADVLHRDLKPGNLLVNADCELKIGDFGLARGFSEDPEQNQGFMTEYVATRWYRAPEIMLSFSNYTKAIDVWSVGCILAELLGGKPLFRGKDYVDQLNQILMILGTPPEDTLVKIGSQRAQNYVRSLPYMKKISYSQLFPNANPLALDLLEKMLTLDPHERISVNDALNHKYLEIWHDPRDEPECQIKFDFKSFETFEELDDMKQLIMEEVKGFREFVRKPIEEQQQIQLQYQMKQKQRQEEERKQSQRFRNQETQPSYSNVSIDVNNSNQSRGRDGYEQAERREEDAYPRPQELTDFSFSNLELAGIASGGSGSGLGSGIGGINHHQNHSNLNNNQYDLRMHDEYDQGDFEFNPSVLGADYYKLEEDLGFGLDGNTLDFN
ncbi:mitogen-activated protein kinase MKC1 [Lodderomyces elongisporus NRRL YB-4239]|uniref:Mitogen-activated protein kinase MKC1 n=1 Tax=Lodderomyces elongisporus (strain ATCC 11503 / CBS 2605 / JCM 1781 / NBRC 1676 / NRRL YB-4239) TaxID=379508 RepID=A5DRL6_LODEL|nr:mitogen-activated protein kinase MKC1 [Lodderomyces elongisporus NRRL YB-4239]